MKPSNDDKLLKESIPSYMQITPDEMETIYGSFFNIFKTMWSSIKLLSSTLALNLKVITYSAFRDQKRIKAAFTTFAAARAKYDTEMIDNLEYFRKSYSDSRLDTLGGFGPKVLAFAANPLLFFANQKAGAAAEVEIPDNDNKKQKNKEEKEEKNVAPTQKMSDRLRNAMIVFGFSVKEGRLLEFVQNSAIVVKNDSLNKAKEIQTAQNKEKIKLQLIAKDMLTTETARANELLAMLDGRPAVIKKIVDAKNFDEMIAAAEAGQRIQMDFSPQAFRSSYDDIVSTLKKESEDNSEKLKKTVQDIRKKYPEITEKDDIKAMTAYMFGVSKASIQINATKEYNSLAASAKSAMFIPVDEETKKQLLTSDEGKKYLAMLDEFEKNLESGQKEMSTITTKKFNVA
jgi:hypothetical protein